MLGKDRIKIVWDNVYQFQWDLVCDKSWIKPAVTSIQMGGVLVGAFIGGQSADTIGRRYTLYVSVLLHGIANVVAAYSVTWQMFAVLRFVLGFMIGSILVVSYTYPMEFIGVKERSVVSSIPNWAVGVALFALTAWRLENWSQLHLVCAALHVVLLVGFLWVDHFHILSRKYLVFYLLITILKTVASLGR